MSLRWESMSCFNHALLISDMKCMPLILEKFMHRLFCEILFSFSPVSFLSFEHVNFWQIREATLFALSSLSEELLETEKPNLIRVALAMPLLCNGLLEHFLYFAMKAIKMDPPPVKVGVCRELTNLLPETKKEIVQSQLLGLISSLTDLLNHMKPCSWYLIHCLLQLGLWGYFEISAYIKCRLFLLAIPFHARVKSRMLLQGLLQSHESSTLVEHMISPVILNVWASHVSDPFISIDALEAIKSIVGCVHPLVSRILPYIGTILNKPQEQADGLVTGSLDLNAPDDVVKAIYDVSFNAVINIILQSDDHSEIQLERKLFVTNNTQGTFWFQLPNLNSMIYIISYFCALLDPKLESSGSLFVGSCILQLILHLPSQIVVHIRDLIAALVKHMQSAQNFVLLSSLLIFIDLLISILAERHGNSFSYIMSEWTKQQGDILLLLYLLRYLIILMNEWFKKSLISFDSTVKDQIQIPNSV
ncbi:hypothetical protein GYH30_010038 [Glycine max]|uniref:Uncharacterized protein n=1 Tax=Glycine max TaxID=3847 RepID=A0A0R0K8N1_SOYBN|nr:hypothetical protein GYH30_010038 [Glycine max]